MRFLDELTQQEIAGKLGISQAHVSGILSRTLRELRDLLSAEDPQQCRPAVQRADRSTGKAAQARATIASPSAGREPRDSQRMDGCHPEASAGAAVQRQQHGPPAPVRFRRQAGDRRSPGEGPRCLAGTGG
jgi:hypothetical protein